MIQKSVHGECFEPEFTARAKINLVTESRNELFPVELICTKIAQKNVLNFILINSFQEGGAQ